MKRTKSINLNRMRKNAVGFQLKPLVVSVAAFSLMACGGSQKAQVYSDVRHCISQNPSLETECEAAYKTALNESARTGPKYRSERDCTSEFGQNNCVSSRAASGGNWFMPAMAGFMMARALDNNNRYHSSPLYTSHSYGSPMYGRWTTSDGRSYGSRRYGSINVGRDAFKAKPIVTRTMSRGGFGSTVAAKSRWSGSQSRGGWGG